jgi:hypothetical protein
MARVIQLQTAKFRSIPTAPRIIRLKRGCDLLLMEPSGSVDNVPDVEKAAKNLG